MMLHDHTDQLKPMVILKFGQSIFVLAVYLSYYWDCLLEFDHAIITRKKYVSV